MIFVSAGFDGHAGDPLAQMLLTEQGYRWFGDWIMELAIKHAKARLVSSFEGGYALEALGRRVAAHVRSLPGCRLKPLFMPG